VPTSPPVRPTVLHVPAPVIADIEIHVDKHPSILQICEGERQDADDFAAELVKARHGIFELIQACVRGVNPLRQLFRLDRSQQH